MYECSICLGSFPRPLVNFNDVGLPFCERCWLRFREMVADMDMPACPCCDGAEGIDHILDVCRLMLAAEAAKSFHGKE